MFQFFIFVPYLVQPFPPTIRSCLQQAPFHCHIIFNCIRLWAMWSGNGIFLYNKKNQKTAIIYVKRQDSQNKSEDTACIYVQYLSPLSLSLVVNNKVTIKCGLLSWKGGRCATNKWPVKRKCLGNIIYCESKQGVPNLATQNLNLGKSTRVCPSLHLERRK